MMERIVTERLILRPWEMSDSGDLYEYAQSELVGPNAGWKAHQSEDESKVIIDMFRRGGDTLAIVLKDESKVIGSIGLHSRKPDTNQQDLEQREIGYVLNPKYWGNGYVPEAVSALVEYGFKMMKLDLIWCAHYDFNDKSRRVNEKCGFNYQFTKKETLERLGDKEVNTLYYNISRAVYEKSKRKGN